MKSTGKLNEKRSNLLEVEALKKIKKRFPDLKFYKFKKTLKDCLIADPWFCPEEMNWDKDIKIIPDAYRIIMTPTDGGACDWAEMAKGGRAYFDEPDENEFIDSEIEKEEEKIDDMLLNMAHKKNNFGIKRVECFEVDYTSTTDKKIHNYTRLGWLLDEASASLVVHRFDRFGEYVGWYEFMDFLHADLRKEYLPINRNRHGEFPQFE